MSYISKFSHFARVASRTRKYLSPATQAGLVAPIALAVVRSTHPHVRRRDTMRMTSVVRLLVLAAVLSLGLGAATPVLAQSYQLEGAPPALISEPGSDFSGARVMATEAQPAAAREAPSAETPLLQLAPDSHLTGTLVVNKGCGASYAVGEAIYAHFKVSSTAYVCLTSQRPDGYVYTWCGWLSGGVWYYVSGVGKLPAGVRKLRLSAGHTLAQCDYSVAQPGGGPPPTPVAPPPPTCQVVPAPPNAIQDPINDASKPHLDVQWIAANIGPGNGTVTFQLCGPTPATVSTTETYVLAFDLTEAWAPNFGIKGLGGSYCEGDSALSVTNGDSAEAYVQLTRTTWGNFATFRRHHGYGSPIFGATWNLGVAGIGTSTLTLSGFNRPSLSPLLGPAWIAAAGCTGSGQDPWGGTIKRDRAPDGGQLWIQVN
jgi:hypothetical protein